MKQMNNVYSAKTKTLEHYSSMDNLVSQSRYDLALTGLSRVGRWDRYKMPRCNHRIYGVIVPVVYTKSSLIPLLSQGI